MRLLALAACAALAVVAIDVGGELTPPSPRWSTPAAVLARTPTLFAALWAAALAGLAAVAWVAPRAGLDRGRAADAAAFAPIVWVAALSLLDMLGPQVLRPENRGYAALAGAAAVAASVLAYRIAWGKERWSWSGAAVAAGVAGLWMGHYRLGLERPGALAIGAATGVIVWLVLARAPVARTAPALAAIGGLTLACGTWAFRDATTRLIGMPARTIAGEAPGTRAILLFSIDTLRRDALSIYNPAVTTTPNFDRLAKDSMIFNAAYSGSSWTLPSVASLMTGEHARTHQTLEAGRRIPDGLETLAEGLSANGFATAAAVRNPWLTFRTGFHRGFDGYADFAPDSTSYGERVQRRYYDHVSEAMLDVAEAWIGGVEERPFFFWLHLLGPHAPYEPLPEYRPAGPPPPGLGWVFGHNDYMAMWRERHRAEGSVAPPSEETQAWARDLYYAGVRTSDRALGRMLDWLQERGLYEQTLIIVVADHGEEIWDHGKLGHGIQLFDEVTRVPLMIKPPEGAAGVAEVPVSTRNVFQTVLDYSGVGANSECSDGFSLRSLVEGGAESEARRGVLIQSGDGLNHQVDGLAANGRKIGRTVGEAALEVYDLEADPGERVALELSGEELAEYSEPLDARLAAARQARECFGLTEALTDESSREGRGLEQLRNLGYIQ